MDSWKKLRHKSQFKFFLRKDDNHVRKIEPSNRNGANGKSVAKAKEVG